MKGQAGYMLRILIGILLAIAVIIIIWVLIGKFTGGGPVGIKDKKIWWFSLLFALRNIRLEKQ